jgi:hypothetical protein
MTMELLPPLQMDHLHWDSISTALRQRFNALLQDDGFVRASTRRDQIGIACRALCGDEDEARVPLSAIATFFGREQFEDVVRKSARSCRLGQSVSDEFALRRPNKPRLIIHESLQHPLNFELESSGSCHRAQKIPTPSQSGFAIDY